MGFPCDESQMIYLTQGEVHSLPHPCRRNGCLGREWKQEQITSASKGRRLAGRLGPSAWPQDLGQLWRRPWEEASLVSLMGSGPLPPSGYRGTISSKFMHRTASL